MLGGGVVVFTVLGVAFVAGVVFVAGGVFAGAAFGGTRFVGGFDGVFGDVGGGVALAVAGVCGAACFVSALGGGGACTSGGGWDTGTVAGAGRAAAFGSSPPPLVATRAPMPAPASAKTTRNGNTQRRRGASLIVTALAAGAFSVSAVSVLGRLTNAGMLTGVSP